ncbi:bifunctional acetate--CoA ligase family protein/GNAT family N-acetyltransferase [Vibrio gallicus]|uniref:bifunctional acetate--CoA ligase family protein/GNAT family N-acetyltransferase n=1 Tax=Vibrio gallicus TaxID=190897 RepID=UPI0021C2D332|nr:bifunctional acetate--CoA ligase family protein/GNAT family N-acetyltransferase [Vibrio gallicus]
MDSLFNPRSLAIIGASNQPRSAGNVIIKNLLKSDYSGTILPVNPKHTSVAGILCYPSLSELPISTEFAVICIEHFDDEILFEQMRTSGVRVAIIIANTFYDPSKFSTLRALSARYKIRLLGPNSLGIILPWANLNASLSPTPVLPGKIAFVSQSAAMGSTILDWAAEKNIGFSAYISIGSMADVGVSEVIDYLAMHSKTEAILLYIEHIKDARSFISAARSCARNKRILVLKGARNDASKSLSIQHHGGLKSLNVVYDSAFERSGILQVFSTHELFAAAETLTHSVPLKGKRLAIITNGSGPAVIATDTLYRLGGKLAQLNDATQDKINSLTGNQSSHCNPIDISGEDQVSRLSQVLEHLMESDCVDAILVMYSPTALADPVYVAQTILDTYQRHPKRQRINLLTNWLGETSAKQARNLFAEAGIPTYRTPESSVTAFMHLIRYRASQIQLMETPLSITKARQPLTEVVSILDSVSGSISREVAHRILSHYDLNLITQLRPVDLYIKMYNDPTFGAVIALSRLDDAQDHLLTIGLPPLNQKLAQTLIKDALKQQKLAPLSETRFDQLTRNLVSFSQMVIDLPCISGITLAGVFDSQHQLNYIDAWLETSAKESTFAIKAYPVELEQSTQLKDATKVTIRPIRPEDEPNHAAFISKVSKEDLYKRFFSDVGEFDHMALANLTQIDYDREMAFIAELDGDIIGVARVITNIRNNVAEFAVLIRSDKKGVGLGKILMQAAIQHSRNKGLKRLEGVTMPTNRGMIGLAQALGFSVAVDFEEGIAEMKLDFS